MREWLQFHLPTVASFLALLVVAGGLGLAMPVPSAVQAAGSPLPAQPIALPGPGEDADGDSYADDVDVADGDLQAGILLRVLDVAADARPYVLVGTQDDHWRTGQGAELAWLHVVDPDPLGRRAGSPGWQADVLRTGAWWMSQPAAGNALTLGEGSMGGADGAHWPQRIWANVRDDRENVTLSIELRDARPSPHRLLATWDLEFDTTGGRVRSGQGAWLALPADLGLEASGARLGVTASLATAPNATVREEVLQRWAPTLRFDSEEAFLPVRGELLERFHGFTRRVDGAADLRTWDFTFNHGRDGYRLFLADFDGDGRTGHHDAQLMADVLRAGDLGRPTVYGDVRRGTGDAVVVQYWMLYFYNFVLDEGGDDIEKLLHGGDREFVQLTFDDLDAARNGTPRSVSFSQHYAGLRLDHPDLRQWPFEDGRLNVFVARGSHANYPAPGDDRRLRPSLTSVFDRFDGEGLRLTPDAYDLQPLGNQTWHAGYLWGPVTRYTRDLGTSARPFLQHDFRYPFTDPIWWQRSLHEATPADLEGMYGATP